MKYIETKNPMNNDIVYMENVHRYLQYCKDNLVDTWNDLDGDKLFNADNIDDIFGTKGYEFAEDVKILWEIFSGEYEDDIEEYQNLTKLVEEVNDEYTSLIHEDYWVEYVEEMCYELEYINRNTPSFIINNMNWENVAQEFEIDYSTVEYESVTYYYY